MKYFKWKFLNIMKLMNFQIVSTVIDIIYVIQ